MKMKKRCCMKMKERCFMQSICIFMLCKCIYVYVSTHIIIYTSALSHTRSIWLCIALYCSIWLYIALYGSILLYIALYCSILLYIALYRSILLYIALYCSIWLPHIEQTGGKKNFHAMNVFIYTHICTHTLLHPLSHVEQTGGKRNKSRNESGHV